MRDRYDESLELLSRLRVVAADDAPQFWDSHIASVLLQAGRLDDAYEQQRQRAESVDGTFDDWGNLAMLYVRSGRPHSARQIISDMERIYLERLEQADAASGSPADNSTRDRVYLDGLIAIVGLECHNWEEGIAAFEKAVGRGGPYAESYHILYARLATSDRFDDALQYIDRDDKHPVRAGFWRGFVLQRQGHLDRARREWQAVTKMDLSEENKDSFLEYVFSFYSLGDTEGTGLGTVLQTLKEARAAHWWLLFLAGIGWAIRGDLDTASSNLELAVFQHKAAALGAKLPHNLWTIAEKCLGSDVKSQLEVFFEPVPSHAREA